MSGSRIEISRDIIAQVAAHARETFPNECCGWLGGDDGTISVVRRCTNAHEQGASSANETLAERNQESAYVIAGEDLKQFIKGYDDGVVKAIYHSHPNGKAYFSETDQQVASPFGEPSYDVLHFVIGLDNDQVREAALFDWSDADGK